jgi:biotin carboxylase
MTGRTHGQHAITERRGPAREPKAGVTVAIVDGHSTGRTLAHLLRRRGVTCVHVHSRPDMPEYFARGFRPEDYQTDLGWVREPGKLASALAEIGVSRVVPGTESGVVLADTLARLLELPGNSPESSGARRDKARMQEAAARAGLATPRGAEVRSVPEALAWYDSSGTEEVAVKPLASAGSDNVHFCRDRTEVASACTRILGSTTVYGDVNRSLVVQERVFGVEYYINTVSWDGAHRVAEIWRYTKRRGDSGSPVYDFEEPVGAGEPEFAVLRRFVFQVLSALGIEYGAAHTEVIMAGHGPVLIETGARLGGATMPEVVDMLCGTSQATLLADVLLDPAALTRFSDVRTGPDGAVRNVAFINEIPGVVRSLEWMDRIAALPTAVRAVNSVAPGSRIPRTVDLFTSPGFVYLAAPDRHDVIADYQRLREMEESGLYTA